MKLIHQVKCPDCGAHVDTEFTVVDTGIRTEHGCTISMTAIQSGPLVCECGFEYVPTASIMRQRLQEARGRDITANVGVDGGGRLRETHSAAQDDGEHEGEQ